MPVKQIAGDQDEANQERPGRETSPLPTKSQTRHPAPEVYREEHHQRRIHRGHVELLSPASQRSVKETASESGIAAGHSKQQAQRGRSHQVSALRGRRPAQVVPPEGYSVQTYEHISEVGPGVGPSAKKGIGVNPLRIARMPKLLALDPTIPGVPAAIAPGNPEQNQG